MKKEIIEFKGDLEWDTSKPDGTNKKQLDVGLLNKLNWRYKIKFERWGLIVFTKISLNHKTFKFKSAKLSR